MKTAKDANQYPLQFGTLVTESYDLITVSTQISAGSKSFIRIAPTLDDAWVQVTANFVGTGTTGVGAFVPFGSSITLEIPDSYFVTSDSAINVVPYGYA
jgi:hypothetical protein